MSMTYRDFMEYVADNFSEEQLDQDMTIFIRGIDEYYPIERLDVEHEDGILDKGHFFFLI